MLFFFLMCTDISNLHEDNWCRSCKLDWKIWWNGMPTCSSWAGERLPSNSCRDSLWCCNSLCSSLCCTDSIWNQGTGVEWLCRCLDGVSTSIKVSYCNNKLSLGNESNIIIIIIIIISRCERPHFCFFNKDTIKLYHWIQLFFNAL